MPNRHPKSPKKKDMTAVIDQSDPQQQTCTAQPEFSNYNQSTKHNKVLRPWPTWRDTKEGGVDRVQKREEATAVTQDMTPMERWSRETQGEGHWNDIHSFAAMREQKHATEPTSGKKSGSTDDGVWFPRNYSRKD